MPPTTTGTSVNPASFMRATTSFTSGRCEPDRIDRPTTCTLPSAAAATIGFGRQADAVIDHVHAGIARAHRDLLGAVGMAVEAGFADQEFQAPAELLRHPVDLGADVVEALGVVAHGACRRRSARGIRRTRERSANPHSPVVTPALAQAIDGGMILAPLLAARRSSSSAAATALASRACAPGVEPRDLLGLDVRAARS